jgi:glycosyltransferase involved in cell wall biosynthesis
MRIGLDASMLGHGGGIPTYAEHLIRGLAQTPGNSLVLWCGSRTSQACVRQLLPERVEIVEPGLATRMLGRVGLFACANPLPIERLVGPVDVFHGLNYLLPAHHGRAARLVTVHDLSLLTHPEWHPRIRARLMGWPLPRTIAKAHHVITDCEAVRVELIERFRVRPERVSAVPLAPSSEFRVQPPEVIDAVVDRYRLKAGEYILFAGALEPRKNVARLVQAVELLRARRRDVVPPLVLVGPSGWRNDEVATRIRSAGSWLRLLGTVPRSDLVALMSGASVLAYPSLSEGFGLPVLEAMACGTPVVASQIGPIVEASGDAALLVDPTDAEEIAEGLRRILEDRGLREDLAKRGLARAATFSWGRTAAGTLSAYAKALDSR